MHELRLVGSIRVVYRQNKKQPSGHERIGYLEQLKGVFQMPTYSQIQIKRGQGLTFAEIGELFGVSRQRIHAIFTGYMRVYKQTEKYQAYKRHYEGHMQLKVGCFYCEENN
jgi:hypothetical protein